MKIIKNNLTATLADQIIAAAQEFEQAAKRMKEQARTIRKEGLTIYADQSVDPIKNIREWQQVGIKQTAVKALRGCGLCVDHLSEVVFAEEVR